LKETAAAAGEWQRAFNQQYCLLAAMPFYAGEHQNF